MGPFGLAARRERAGGDAGFWDLADAERLPEETADYVPRIQAYALALRNLRRLKLYSVQQRSPQITADLQVPPGTRLGLVARGASTSLDRLRALNLDLLGDCTPELEGFQLQVPSDVVWRARESLGDRLSRGDTTDLCVQSGFDWGQDSFTRQLAKRCNERAAP